MTEDEAIQAIVNFCNTKLALDNPIELTEYGYANLSLCVIDAVFSINARYKAVENVILHYQEHYPPDKQSLADLLQAYEAHGLESMVNDVYRNRQRTSPRGGILKAEAVFGFAKVLAEFSISTKEDALKLIWNAEFENRIFQIPGQGSGVSLAYFYMLCGETDMVKPDRRIVQFVHEATGLWYKSRDCQRMVIGASHILDDQYTHLNARMLDSMIWKFMERRQKISP